MLKEAKKSRAAPPLTKTLAASFIILSIVLLVLYGTFETFTDYRTRESVILNSQQLIAQEAGKTVSSFIQENFSVLETTLRLTDPERKSSAQQREILQALLGLRPAFRRIVLRNAQNRITAQASRLSTQASPHFLDLLPGLRSPPKASIKRMISPVYIDPSTSEPLTAMSVPVTDVFGDYLGTLTAELNLKSMWDIVDLLKVGRTGYVYVSDRKGDLIAFHDTSRVLKGENVSRLRAVADFIQNHQGQMPKQAIRYQGILGSNVVGTYVPLKSPDWAVITELPWKEAYRDILWGTATSAGLTLVLAALAGIFGLFLARRLAAPVINLTNTASRIAAGESDLQAPAEGPEEVARLAVAFNSMTAQLRQSWKELEQRFDDLKRTEEAGRLSEERLRLALEGTSDGIWDWNLQTGRVYFSPRYYAMLGYEPDEFPGSFDSWRHLIHPEDRGPAEQAVQRAIEEHSPFAIEFRFQAKNGDWRWILGRGKVVESDPTGKAVRVAGSHSDITEHKQAQIALRESEQKYRVLVESAQPIIFILDENGVFQLSEGQGLAKLGLQPGQVVGQSAFELYRDIPSVVEGIKQALAGKSTRTIDIIEEVVFDTVYSPYFTPDGRQQGLVGIAIDITERTRAEAAAKDHQERLALALQGADLGSWDWNVPTGETRFNDRWAEMLGYRLEEIEPRLEAWETLIHPDDLPRVLEVLTAHLEGRTPSYETEHRLRHKSGSWVWVLDRGRVIERDTAGCPLRAVGTHLDISERKRVEEALEKRLVALTQPLEVADEIGFEDMFNLADIQQLQDLYAQAFGVAALMTRPDGTPITQPSNFTPLCGEIIRQTSKGFENCSRSDALIGRQNPSGPNIQPCLSAGLCNAGASITVGGYHVANWLIGQVRDEAQKEEEVIPYCREIGADEKAFRAAYRQVPVMSSKQFERVAQVLFVVAKQISTMAYQNIQQARFIAERKRVEETLHQYERIVSTSQDLMGLVSRNYIYDAVNESVLRAHRLPREKVVGHAVPEVLGTSLFREKIQPRLDQALAGRPVHFQETFEFAGPGPRIMDVSYFPAFDPTGNVQGVVLNSRDITETLKLKEQLHALTEDRIPRDPGRRGSP